MQGGSARAKDDQSKGWCYQKLDADRRALIARSGYGNFPDIVQTLYQDVLKWLHDGSPPERVPPMVVFSPTGFQVSSRKLPCHASSIIASQSLRCV
jgi:hypothetical protein